MLISAIASGLSQHRWTVANSHLDIDVAIPLANIVHNDDKIEFCLKLADCFQL